MSSLSRKGDETRPYAYQRVGVRKIERFGGVALLADDLGLGKTFQALLWARNFLGKNDPIVVVCPANVKYHWEREARKHVHIRAEVLEHMRPSKSKPPKSARIYVVNYDILGDVHSKRPTWLKFLRKVKPALVVIDEVHYVANPRAKRTKAVRALCKRVTYRIGLGGTPLLNNPAELWSICNILWPDEFPSFMEFAFTYTEPKRTPWGWRFKGAKNLKSLNKRLRKLGMVRRLKKDVLKDLPTKTTSVVTVPVSNRKEYDEAERDFIKWLAKISRRKAVRALRVQQLVRSNYLKTLIARLKVDSIAKWVDNFLRESDGKLVVFGTRNHALILPLYEKFKRQAALVTGKVTGRKRQRAIDSFVNDDKVRVLFGNLGAVGVGVDGLQKVCCTGVMADLPWTPGAVSQGLDRLYRIGQEFPVNWYFLLAKDTIEEKLCRVIQEKQQVLNEVLDGAEKVEGSVSVLDDFLKAVLEDDKRKGKVMV